MLAGAAADRAVVHSGEPIHSGYVLIRRDHLANVTSLKHEQWRRERPESCREVGIRWAPLNAGTI